MIDWATIIEDGVRAFQQRTPESIERFIMNASTQVIVNMQVHVYRSWLENQRSPMEIAPPTIGEPLGEDFVKELRLSTTLEEKYRFTSEGSFVRD
jgi:hypothetical protein